uniref:Uncharacterized protein n=2 Tax=Tetranychus urticae TaxID=32264 RepID=T1KXP1_TETUR
MYISFSKPPVGNDVYPENPFVGRADDRASLLIEKSYPGSEEIPQGYYRTCTKQDYRDKFFRDGDCFALNTKMGMYPSLDGFSVQYRLVHKDLIDETECDQWFCHHISNKAYLTKQAKITNSNIESYLRDQPRPNVRNRIYDDELHAVVSTREREIHADLDIGQYFNSYCSFSHDEMFRTIRPRIYWPNRG